MKICLVGNPNTGKSSIFNALTGLNRKTGNFPGVTVEKFQGQFKSSTNETHSVIDLPGIYSLYTKSDDEKVVSNILLDKNNEDHPDVVVFICDATNLRRNLLLLTQIADLDLPVIVALTMTDIAEKKNIKVNVNLLSKKLGLRIVPVSGKSSAGVADLKKAIDQFHPISTQNQSIHVNELAPQIIDDALNALGLENPYMAFQLINQRDDLDFLSEQQKQTLDFICKKYSYNLSSCLKREVTERYSYINDVLFDCVKLPFDIKQLEQSNKIDKILTHKYIGFGIFFFIMFVVFQMIYTVASIPMDAIDFVFSELILWGHSVSGGTFLSDLFWDGIVAGLSGILIFIPQIAILFFFISLLEDSGYMARVTVIFDKLMHKVGLSGHSIIHLIGGYACAIPSIIATRNIQDRSNRLITILVLPLVSCSARLPIYTLIIALTIPNTMFFGFLNLQGIVMMGLYIASMLLAVIAAWCMKFFIHSKKGQNFFILELPTYKLPNFRKTIIIVIQHVKTFVVEAGKIIMVISIILFFLSSYSMPGVFAGIEKKYRSDHYSQWSGSQIEQAVEAEKLEKSFIGIIGKSIEPVVSPLGFDWRIGIALVTSFAAREVFVGTMSTLFGVNEEDNTIINRLRNAKNEVTGNKLFDLPTSFSLLAFYLIAMQCMSTLAVTRKETKSWKWPFIQLAYLTILAFVASKVVFEITSYLMV